ncbi:MAG: hypothetical protein MUF87_09795 [Anaerolineae bacterium]|nr:hypothetical protein [Anaerolineae bacterium]
MNDPNPLAEDLDRHFPPHQTTLPPSGDDPLLNAALRLASAPRPTLSPTARALIEAQVRATPIVLRPRFPWQLGVAIAAAFLLIVVWFMFSPEIDPADPTPTVQIAQLMTTIAPSPSATNTLAPSPSATNTLAPSPSATHTIAPSLTLIPPTPLVAIEPIALTPLPVIVILEGEIEAIDLNRVTVYGFTVILAAEDPYLAVLRIGDLVRVEGELAEGRILIADTIVLNNDDPAQNVIEAGPNGVIWRDSGDCSHPPPAWAPAQGWRARCESPAPNPGGSGNGNSNGNGNRGGNHDDDDDDDDD